jgi:hypothetical protein
MGVSLRVRSRFAIKFPLAVDSLATNQTNMTFNELLFSIPLSAAGFQALMISNSDSGGGEVTMEMVVIMMMVGGQ